MLRNKHNVQLIQMSLVGLFSHKYLYSDDSKKLSLNRLKLFLRLTCMSEPKFVAICAVAVVIFYSKPHLWTEKSLGYIPWETWIWISVQNSLNFLSTHLADVGIFYRITENFATKTVIIWFYMKSQRITKVRIHLLDTMNSIFEPSDQHCHP